MSDPDLTSPEVAGPAATRTGTSTRSKARKRALDILFESELRDRSPLDSLAERSAAGEQIRDYTRQLVTGVTEHRPDLDHRISGALATGWTLDRLPRVDRQALRIAAYELDHTDLPEAVAVSEAVHLAQELSTDQSPAFVNGVLGTLAASRAQPGEPAAG